MINDRWQARNNTEYVSCFFWRSFVENGICSGTPLRKEGKYSVQEMLVYWCG